MADPVYWFDPSVGAYITNDGEWVTLKELVAQGNASLAASTSAINDMAGLVANGQLSADAWYSLMQEEIKQEIIVQYILGHGGMVDDMTHADWGRIGSIVKEQYKYLGGFRDDIIAGNLTEGQISSRAGMYINSAREAFSKARGQVMGEAGNDEEKWVLGATDNHCGDCSEYASQDWQPIDTFPNPGDGSTQCLCIVSANAPVLTYAGWKPLFDVKVGDYVWTHEKRWKKVTGLVMKPSLPGHQLCVVNGVMATSNHLWWTNHGWKNGLYIHNSFTLLYNHPIQENGDGKKVYGMWYDIGRTYKEGEYLQIVQNGMSLWKAEGLPGERMRQVFPKRKLGKNQETMANDRPAQEGASGSLQTSNSFTGHGETDLANQVGWPQVELVLAGRGEPQENTLPLSVGLDNGERPNSEGLRSPSQERRPHGRFIGKPGVTTGDYPQSPSRKDCTPEGIGQDAFMDMQTMRETIQDEQTGKQERWTRPEILLGGLLPPGTALFDLTVEDDHSFCVGGLFAHNTNCGCTKIYRNSQTGQEEDNDL